MLERLQQLGGRTLFRVPGERQPLDPVGVGVLGGGEAALREPQLAEHVVERRVGDLAVALFTGDYPRVEVDRDEQGVVIEHLLEMRHEPALID